MRDTFRNEIEKKGLRFFGVAPITVAEDYSRYESWLQEKRHAGMGYLAKNREVRKDPTRLLEGTRSIIIAGLPYYQGDTWPKLNEEAPRVAQYARFKDYHKELKECLEGVVSQVSLHRPGHQFRVAVDSLPLLERALAAKTCEGFIGKNTCYIHPSSGSFFLLGEILTTLELEADQPEKSKACASCTKCQVECPTGALNTEYQIDSSRCLSYWTIENRGTIPEEFWPWMAEYVFGCDICQLVCPYNEVARSNDLPKRLTPLSIPDLFSIATMDQKQYEYFFGGTPMTRAKRTGLIRNVLIAMTMTRDKRLEEAILHNQDSQEPVIQGTLEQIKRFRFPYQ